jgi:hypothetical protein
LVVVAQGVLGFLLRQEMPVAAAVAEGPEVLAGCYVREFFYPMSFMFV